MRCFYHEDKEAVGTCKSCGRGLCRECAVELPKSLACRGRCEADAQAVSQLIDRNIQISGASSRLARTGRNSRVAIGLFHVAIGVAMLMGGLHSQLPMITFLGIALLAYGIYWLFLAWKLWKQLNP
jgi:hypothetical protein